MKRILIVIITVLIASSAMGQTTFLDRNKTFDINVGYIGHGTNMTKYRDGVHNVNAVSGSLCIYGVYLDVASNSKGDHSRNLGIDQYEGYRTRSWHIGYALPVCDFIKIIPYIGASRWAEGYWDGSDWYVNEDGINNKFITTGTEYHLFDPGIVVQGTIARYINIFLNVSRCNIGAGIGISLPFEIFSRKY
ncbi:MAG: hypothetical protein J6R02_06775 [Alistipes sp.]|nr:hypothetical protein [Alistipes sp.]